MTDRRLLRLTGADTQSFLQGLITNDIKKVESGLVYAALLTPQGKYIADFFVFSDGDAFLIDVAAEQADALAARLTMYKLRADVAIAPCDLHLHRGLGPAPDGGFDDPRHAALGWRAYRDVPAPASDVEVDWNALYVTHLVPRAGSELTSDTFVLEAGFERLNGVDFRKGCYVGQEVTARMKHKTELRKGLALVEVEGDATPGSEITANGKPAGKLHSRAGDRAIAYLRFDRAQGDMRAGEAQVRLLSRAV